MSKKTHQQQLAARKAKRQAERDAERRRQRRNLAVTVASIVTVVVVVVGAFVVFGGGDGKPAAAPSVPAENKPSSIPTAMAPAPKRPKPLAAEVTCTYKKSAESA